MKPGLFYNTNGFAHHRLGDACRILADLGYDGVSLTPDVHHLDPERSSPAEVDALRGLLDALSLQITLESGARYLLDPQRKHYPTLLTSAAFGIRQDSYRAHIDLAVRLGSPILSIWSGSRESDTPPFDDAVRVLAERMMPVLEYAEQRGVLVTFEPEPGMLIERVDQWAALCGHLRGAHLALTLDTGHVEAVESTPVAELLDGAAADLALIQLDDSKKGRHEHLMFGEGSFDFDRLFSWATSMTSPPPLSVELSRHSHDAVETARKSAEFILRGLERYERAGSESGSI